MIRSEELREISDNYIESRMPELVDGLEESMSKAAHRGKTHYYTSVEDCMVDHITDFLCDHGYRVENSSLQPYEGKRSLRVAW